MVLLSNKPHKYFLKIAILLMFSVGICITLGSEEGFKKAAILLPWPMQVHCFGRL